MNQNYKKASFLLRLLSFFIDGLILLIPLVFLTFILNFLGLTNFGWIFGILIIFIYNVFFLTKFGATPGKMVLRMKVVDISYNDADLKQIIIRETIGSFISNLFFSLGYLWMMIDKNTQGWNDKIAKTFVVKLDSQKSFITQPAPKKIKPLVRTLFFVFAALMILSTVISFIYIFIGFPLLVSDNSMKPNYNQGEIVLATSNFTTLKRSDVVVYNFVNSGKKYQLMQRIIGLPGESVILKDSKIYINAHLLNQSKRIPADVKTLPGPYLQDGVGIIVPNHYYLLMGDNRGASVDSRTFGVVPRYAIKAKVTGCIFNCKK